MAAIDRSATARWLRAGADCLEADAGSDRLAAAIEALRAAQSEIYRTLELKYGDTEGEA